MSWAVVPAARGRSAMAATAGGHPKPRVEAHPDAIGSSSSSDPVTSTPAVRGASGCDTTRGSSISALGGPEGLSGGGSQAALTMRKLESQSTMVSVMTSGTMKKPCSATATAAALLLLLPSLSVASQLDSTRESQVDGAMRVVMMSIMASGVGPHTPISSDQGCAGIARSAHARGGLADWCACPCLVSRCTVATWNPPELRGCGPPCT